MINFLLRRVRVVVLATFLALLGLFALTPSPAHATASGCSVYHSIPTPWVPLPTGYECYTVYGDGSTITSMVASWRATNLCNWRMDWVTYYQGRTWWRDNGPAHNHCDYVSGGRSRGSGWAPIGSQVCAELYSTPQNAKIEAVCHDIS